MPTKLILIRHGETDLNLNKRYCGSMDIELNLEGKKQARKLCKRLKNEKIHKVYSSDSKRAMQTARIVFEGREIERDSDLRELSFGCFEGLTYEQILKRHPKIYKKWLNNPFSVVIPEGEDLRDFRKRIVGALKKIISSNPDKTIAVVSHGGAISIYITDILKSTKNFWKLIPRSASINIVEHKNNKGKIRLLNDTSHLG